MNKIALLLAMSLSATAANAQQEVTICEDYVSDGGRSYWLEESRRKCERAMNKESSALDSYLSDGSLGLKSVYEMYKSERAEICAEYTEMIFEPAPPKTIERRCETYIDNRGEQ